MKFFESTFCMRVLRLVTFFAVGSRKLTYPCKLYDVRVGLFKQMYTMSYSRSHACTRQINWFRCLSFSLERRVELNFVFQEDNIVFLEL